MKDIDGRDKITCLWGISERMLLIKQNTKDWILSRKMAGLKSLSQMSNIDLARDIFRAWDYENKGYLTVDELNVQLMSLGLCTSRQFVERLLTALSKDGRKLELLTLKQFLKVF